jgi:hypothetical protein
MVVWQENCFGAYYVASGQHCSVVIAVNFLAQYIKLIALIVMP